MYVVRPLDSFLVCAVPHAMKAIWRSYEKCVVLLSVRLRIMHNNFESFVLNSSLSTASFYCSTHSINRVLFAPHFLPPVVQPAQVKAIASNHCREQATCSCQSNCAFSNRYIVTVPSRANTHGDGGWFPCGLHHLYHPLSFLSIFKVLRGDG